MRLTGSTRNRLEAEIPDSVIEGHYRYSTQLLWPLMHGMSALPDFDETDRNCFRSFNLVLATHLNWDEDDTPCRLHGYQHALIPQYLSPQRAESAYFFWGITWAERPRKELQDHAEEIARSLLRCRAIAFRTSKDMHNFARFVRFAIPEVKVTANGRQVQHPSGRATQLLVTPGAARLIPAPEAA